MAKHSVKRTTEGFSIANMQDDYDSAFEALYSGILDQNPRVNHDVFDLELRKLIMRFGDPNELKQLEMYSPYNKAFASLAESSESIESVYNEAGDLLCLSFAEFKRGKRRDALQLFEAAIKHDDMIALVDALQINNANSNIGLEVSSSSDEDEDEEWNDISADDDSIPLNDEDDDESDNIDVNKEIEDVEADDTPLEEETYIPPTNNNKVKEDEDETENVKVKPLLGIKPTISLPSIPNKEDILKIAAANRLSQSGSKDSLLKARKVFAA